MRQEKFFNRKFPITVEGEDYDIDSSSEGKSDHLSYSYSCVKSFRKNQHIIGDLAALHNRQDFQGSTHQPALYSLSGPRNQAVCQPFYCSTISEGSDNAKEEEEHEYSGKRGEKHMSSGESQHHPPVKDNIIKWLKHQFKQVNSLWSFSLSKDICVPKVFRKNKKMKIEMMLNSVDEETKLKLIEYINKFNLGFEEHCSLCNGKETVFEIDVSSIVDDPYQLQSFITFLKGIDSEKSKETKKNVASSLNNRTDLENSPQIINFRKKNQKTKKVDSQTKSCNNLATVAINTYRNYSLSAASSESNRSLTANQKPNCLNQKRKYEGVREHNILNPTLENFKTNHQIFKNKVNTILPQGKKLKNKDLLITLCRENVPPEANVEQNNKPSHYREFEQNIFSAQTNVIPVSRKRSQLLTEVNRESCKCFIHNSRGDFYRYKNQCLFGQGDEINNSFIKYVNKEEKKPELLLSDKDKLDLETDRIYEDKIYKTFKEPVNEIHLPNDSKKYVPKGFENKSHRHNPKTEAIPHREVPLKEVLFLQDKGVHSLKNTFCLNEYSSSTSDNNNDLKEIINNACFKHFNFCLDSPSIMSASDELSVREVTKERDNIFNYGNLKKGTLTNAKGMSGLQTSYFESDDQHCNSEDVKTDESSVSSRRPNTGFGKKHCVLAQTPDLDVKTQNSKKGLENNMIKVNTNMNNKFESPTYNCNLSYVTYEEDTRNGEKLGDLVSNNISPFSSINNFNKSLLDISTVRENNEMNHHQNDNKCCIFCCDNEKKMKRKSKIKTIVFKIGSSNRELKVSSIPSSSKRNSKLKPLKAKEASKRMSSVSKGNEFVNDEECLNLIWCNEKSDGVNCSSMENTNFTNKSNISNSWVDCEDFKTFVGSLTSRSKDTTQTINSTLPGSSSLTENCLGILLSELKNQRMEIDYLKTLLVAKDN